MPPAGVSLFFTVESIRDLISVPPDIETALLAYAEVPQLNAEEDVKETEPEVPNVATN